MAHRLQAWSFLFCCLVSRLSHLPLTPYLLGPGQSAPPPPSVPKDLPDQMCTGAAYEPPAAWPPGHTPPSFSPSPALEVHRAESHPAGGTAL